MRGTFILAVLPDQGHLAKPRTTRKLPLTYTQLQSITNSATGFSPLLFPDKGIVQ